MKKIIDTLSGMRNDPPPIWLMRQAGRYLPEYRALRERAGSFLELCYSPELVTEATLQPVRRFGFDAAIIFSDILVLPDALGQKVTFETGEGPQLAPLDASLSGIEKQLNLNRLEPVLKAISMTKENLSDEIALIGFCGAPWTLSTYMVGGRGGRQDAAQLLAYKDRRAFQELIDLLTRSCVEWLTAQVEAGVEIIQIFDSWAGTLPRREFEAWCLGPMKIISSTLKRKFKDCKIIWFPRGASAFILEEFLIENIDCVGLDTAADFKAISSAARRGLALQGNIDPLALLSGGPALRKAVKFAIEDGRARPHIINLGHGVLPQTPIEHVSLLVKLVKEQGV